MDLTQLRSFVKIGQTGNLRKAAEMLNISQSALSSQIKNLEENLNLHLFNRSSRGMQLNDNGRILYSHATDLLKGAEAFLGKARELSGRPAETIKIGINTDGSFLKVSKLSRILKSHFPQTSFIFVSSQTIRTAEMLRTGTIDLGFFFGDNWEADIVSQTISYFDIRIAVPSKFLDGNEDMNWRNLSTLPWIWSVCNCPFYQIIQAEMDERGLQPNRFADAMDESVVKELVMDNQGIGILREDDARYVASLSQVTVWEDESFQVPLGLAMLEQHKSNRTFQEIQQLIAELWQDDSQTITRAAA